MYTKMIKAVCGSTRSPQNRLERKRERFAKIFCCLLLPHQGLTIRLSSIYSATSSHPYRDQKIAGLNSLTFLFGISHACITRSVISLAARIRDFIRGSRVSGANDRGSGSDRIDDVLRRLRRDPVRYITSSATGLPLALSVRKPGNIIQIVSRPNDVGEVMFVFCSVFFCAGAKCVDGPRSR